MYLIALLAFASVALGRFGLSWLNLRHLAREGASVPAVLAREIDAERLARISAYTAARSRLGLLRSALSTLVLGAFLFAGGLGLYDGWIASIAHSFIAQGVVFLLGLALAGSLLSIPFQLYSDFRLEARYGFNRQTAGLWWSDWLKSTLLSLLLLAALSAGALWLVKAAPHSWWIWVSALVIAVSLLLTVLSPYLIEPLFYRMEPLDAAHLRDGIRAMTERAGVHVGRVLKMDASRRSSHSNAYFTGFGRQKRVVLFDTLLNQMSEPQILAVLAHELGHWKKHHVLVRMLALQALLVLAAFLFFWVSPSALVPALVGLEAASFPARIFILAVAASTLLFPLTPLFSAWSRRDEREADRFAVELHGAPSDLADALAKLGSENLSNLHPHPLYAAFYYSHPPLAERVGSLRALAR
ncbi:MAG TPA: M48 family metallopeptidase [Polyangiaceae bacterium]|jgi:STE24 endopeptidase|nr:M48 family metallopeptidase [Polyangiaceae bacterium]